MNTKPTEKHPRKILADRIFKLGGIAGAFAVVVLLIGVATGIAGRSDLLAMLMPWAWGIALVAIVLALIGSAVQMTTPPNHPGKKINKGRRQIIAERIFKVGCVLLIVACILMFFGAVLAICDRSDLLANLSPFIAGFATGALLVMGLSTAIYDNPSED